MPIHVPNRRALLTGSVASIVAGRVIGSNTAEAQSIGLTTAPSTGPAGTTRSHVVRLGPVDATIVSDGTMGMPLGWVLPDRSRGDVAALFATERQVFEEIVLQVNVTLLKIGADLILVDCGAGGDFAPQRGWLVSRLAEIGVQPDSITKVVLTHAHPDHFWGLFDPLDGECVFSNARLFISEVERDTWLKAGVETRVPDAIKGAAIGTQRRLRQLSARLETFQIGSEISPGLLSFDTTGHTPGHVGVIVGTGSDAFMIGGDALTQSVVSFAAPRWRWGADWDPDGAVASRIRLLEMLAIERMPLIGYHLPWPGLGRVERSSSAFRFVPS